MCTLHQHISDRSSLPLSISFALVHQFIFCLDLYSSHPLFAFAYEVDVAQYLSQSFKFLFLLKSIEQSNFLCIFLTTIPPYNYLICFYLCALLLYSISVRYKGGDVTPVRARVMSVSGGEKR